MLHVVTETPAIRFKHMRAAGEVSPLSLEDIEEFRALFPNISYYMRVVLLILKKENCGT